MNSLFRRKLLISLGILASAAFVAAAQPVKLAVEKLDGRDLIRLQNYRVALTINPARGGAVTSYSDKLAPAELVLQKPNQGLCLDHFQEQNWPGEFLEVPYEYKILKQTPDEAQVMVWRTASGIWRGKLANKKLSGILLEKTYTLRADSPALTCTVRLTAPANEAKVFSYWMQHVFFAGGDYDPATDRTFRPSARGVRSSGKENNSFYGREEWLRDFTDAWMALVDTRKRTGLATMTGYDDVRVLYACGGNTTNEVMFNTTYLPGHKSRKYTVLMTPIVGMERVMYAGPRMIVGGAIHTDNKGTGRVDFRVARSAEAAKDVAFDVTIVGATDGKESRAGSVAFGTLSDRPQAKSLEFTKAPLDPIVVRVTAKGHTSEGEGFTASFEDFFAGAYKWADNIQTDMRTPVYAAERPPQKLILSKPAELRLRPAYQGRYLFMQGLLDEEYDVAAALHSTGYSQETDVIYYRYGGQWFGSLTDFPYDYDELLNYGCIILGGVSKSGLKPVGVEMLHDYLLAGGGMIVLGSHGAYGRSKLKGTKLGDSFPVEFSGSAFDLQSTGAKRVTVVPGAAPFLKHLSLSDRATCYFIHRATPKPGAQVLMEADGKPFMVAGEYGPANARIVCVLGAPMGEPSGEQVPFWKEPQWYLILRNVIWWTSKNDAHFQE